MAARPDRAGRQTCEGYAFVGAEFHLRALFDRPFLVCLRLLRRSMLVKEFNEVGPLKG
jgi:hypothetical protein